jgi:hypothetical protein
VIRIGEAPTAADRHEARISDLRKDHGGLPSPASAQHLRAARATSTPRARPTTRWSSLYRDPPSCGSSSWAGVRPARPKRAHPRTRSTPAGLRRTTRSRRAASAGPGRPGWLTCPGRRPRRTRRCRSTATAWSRAAPRGGRARAPGRRSSMLRRTTSTRWSMASGCCASSRVTALVSSSSGEPTIPTQ